MRRPAGELCLALLLCSCTARYCAACAGVSSQVELSAVDPLSLEVSERWVRGPTPALSSDTYAGVSVSLDLQTPSGAVCRTLQAPEPFTLDGAPLRLAQAGGGQVRLAERGQAPERCTRAEASLESPELLGGPVSGPDVLVAGGTTVSFWAGRPKAELSERGVRLWFEGYEGGAVVASSLKLWLGARAVETSAAGLELTLAAPLELDGGVATLTGDVKLSPRATCVPARSRCEVRLSYPLRVPVAGTR